MFSFHGGMNGSGNTVLLSPNSINNNFPNSNASPLTSPNLNNNYRSSVASSGASSGQSSGNSSRSSGRVKTNVTTNGTLIANGSKQTTPNGNTSRSIKQIMNDNRNSLCLSPVASDIVPVIVGPPKRRSWCGFTPNSKRYAEIGLWKSRVDSEAFVHQTVFDRSITTTETTAPRLAPFRLGPLATSAEDSLDQSNESLSSDEDEEREDSENSNDTGYGITCEIKLIERLTRTHPVWYLLGIQRAGAIHLLQGKEEGNFVVRQSSQSDTMALSVRLPQDKGPYIEHYLILSANGRIGLEASDNRFDDIPSLIAHYCQCCDELPVQLTLPRAIREASTRQQLSSLALLGQEFWRYPMANPRTYDAQNGTNGTLSGTPNGTPNGTDVSSPDSDINIINNNAMMRTFKRSSITSVGTLERPKGPRPTPPNTLNLVQVLSKSNPPSFTDQMKSPPPPPPRWTKPGAKDVTDLDTPSNYTVTTTVVFSLNDEGSDNHGSNTSSFERKSDDDISRKGDEESSLTRRLSPEGISTISSHGSVKLKTVTSSSSSSQRSNQLGNNTNTFGSNCGSLKNGSSTPSSLSNKQNTSQILSPTNSTATTNIFSPADTLSPMTPDTVSPLCVAKSRTSKRTKSCRKESRHYQESDILDSPIVYCRSSLGEKISDYEDIWNNEAATFKSKFTSSDLRVTPTSHIDDDNNEQQKMKNRLNLELSNLFNNGNLRETRVLPTPQPPELDAPKPKQGSPFYAEPADSILPSMLTKQKWPTDKSKSSEDDSSDWKGSECNLIPCEKDKPQIRAKTATKWQPAWQFMGNDFDEDWSHLPAPVLSPYAPDSPEAGRETVTQIIAHKFPELRSIQSSTSRFSDISCRMSSYDNLRAPPSEISCSTVFSEPWNENAWTSGHANPVKEAATVVKSRLNRKINSLASSFRAEATRSSAISAGTTIKNYCLSLAQDKTTTFAKQIENFISCTRESRETNPQVVMRNMRQFMSGIKNYLVKHGEGGFIHEVEKERSKLKANEFLNLDSILESVLHRLVVRPLRAHLQSLLVDYYQQSGDIKLIIENIQYANTKTLSELSINISPPSDNDIETITSILTRLQVADSPLDKLDNLLAAISSIFTAIKSSNDEHQLTTTDDFLPILVWILARTNFVSAEIEAEYMWGLLHSSVLNGEGGYYLTTLSSAVHVLKNLKANKENTKFNKTRLTVEYAPLLKIVVPDERLGSILTKTLPVKPNMSTRQICKIIALKSRITNPQDYALYRLIDGEETLLSESECPEEVRTGQRRGMLVYKRIDAKIAWPKNAVK